MINFCSSQNKNMKNMSSLRAIRLEYLQRKNAVPITDDISDDTSEEVHDITQQDVIPEVEEIQQDVIPEVEVSTTSTSEVEDATSDSGMIRYPTGFEVSDVDIQEKHFVSTSKFALMWIVLPLSPSGTIDPSFKIACREGADANSPLMKGSDISIFYVFDRERTIERLKRLDLDEDIKKRELIALGFEEAPQVQEVQEDGDVEILNYDAIQNLQGDAQLRALMQASQHESEEYELALALSLSASSYTEPVHIDITDIEEGTSRSSSQSELSEEYEGYEEDGSFDYKGKWFVFDNRYLSIFLDMPFNERPTFISGKHKFSLTPDHWAAVKIRCSHVETSKDGAIERLNEDFKRRYHSLLE